MNSTVLIITWLVIQIPLGIVVGKFFKKHGWCYPEIKSFLGSAKS